MERRHDAFIAYPFEVAFFQYILSNTGRYPTISAVSENNGTVSPTVSGPTVIEPSLKSQHAGISATLHNSSL
jgi:hypothetical protein